MKNELLGFALLLSVNTYAADFSEELKKLTSDLNFIKASGNLKDSLSNFVKNKNTNLDKDLYQKIHNNNLCTLSFVTLDELPKYTIVVSLIQENLMDLKDFEQRWEMIEELKSADKELDTSIVTNREKLRTYCTFKVEAKSLENMSSKEKENSQIVNEDYAALMKAKSSGHPDLVKIIGETESILERKIQTETNAVGELYKKLVFTAFSQMFSMQDIMVRAKLDTVLVGDCLKLAETIYEKQCASKATYVDFPGIGLKRRACFSENVQLFQPKCKYEKF
ncbi:hypothetical protein SHI21_17135 [Bacteriovorax sp. PP10]|uniref:Uncharacterized protein n=1 Tax=Bacteriovorax antarcticus TaxID=3088717 RepID=A0ABU5W074_9BACT|nr:hypothetical protein [Bacteriovorax sp. PP10]MEA9357959.1 hypothetical protein [Bacteriovorax sp. PP10]